MKSTMRILAFALVLFVAATTTSCERNNSNPVVPLVTDTIVMTVSADAQNGSFTLFKLSNESIVPTTQQQTANWDMGMRFTTFITNSGTNGPSAAGVQILDGTFEGTLTAPETGYVSTIDDYNQFATYNSTTRQFTPRPGRIFILRTADNKFAKLEMLRADFGPLAGTPPRPTTIIYTFRYQLQANGTRNF